MVGFRRDQTGIFGARFKRERGAFPGYKRKIAWRGHLRPGQTRTYTSLFPTSGSHHRTPTEPGYYETHQPPIHLVHALEHGHIVIYYDKPDAEGLKTLRVWSGLYSGQWDGVVVTPKPGLGQKIVLTAWAKRLDQNQLDMPLAAAFINAFRGRGPENPVR